MSLDDLPAGARPRHEPETVVRRVDRASPYQDKITRAEELRLQLADEIVRGGLPPGTALDETDIARRFKVSRTPVREALRQLVASGLVDARAHRGAVVARPSIERLTGMFEAMAELEALCAGLAAERMSPAERHRLEAIHEELRVLSYAGNPDRFHEVNERFHNAIYAGSQNGYIAEITLAQSWASRKIARRARPRGGRDHARRPHRRRSRDARPYRAGARRIRGLRGVGVEVSSS